MPDWYLDELAYAGRENLDPVHVAGYDDKEDAGAEAELAILLSAGVGPESDVVEFGPGTGQLTVLLGARCRRLVAVDVSPVMIDHLRRRLFEQQVADVEVVQAGFLSYAHQGPPVDAVYSRLALHHLPDFWKVVALQRIRELLRPGGVFRLSDVVFSFSAAETRERIEAWCAAYGDATDADWGRRDVAEHVRDEHSTYTWLLEPMLEQTGFAIEDRDYTDGVLASYLLRAA